MSKVFEDKVDRWASDYIRAKVFWTGTLPKDDPDVKAIMNCESIWEYLWEQAQDWLDEHKGWLVEGSNESEDKGKCEDCSVKLSGDDKPHGKCQGCIAQDEDEDK